MKYKIRVKRKIIEGMYSDYVSYQVQKKVWWWPFWFNLRYSSSSLETVVEAAERAKQFHPAWDNCSDGAKALHTRNIFQVMGRDLKTPSSFLLCYSVPKGNSISGGTRTAWEYAKDRGIPCYNLFHEDVQERILKYIG